MQNDLISLLFAHAKNCEWIFSCMYFVCSVNHTTTCPLVSSNDHITFSQIIISYSSSSLDEIILGVRSPKVTSPPTVSVSYAIDLGRFSSHVTSGTFSFSVSL